MKKRILSILMCLFLALSIVPVSAGAVEDAEGKVTITKQLVSSVADEDGNYTIKLTVQGNPISSNVNTNADVVLVVDNSGSMASSVGVECGSTTFNYTNTKDFSLGGTGFYWDIYECPDCGARYIRCYSKFLGQEAQTFYDERPNTESGENCTGEMGNIIRINAARDVSKEFAQAILRDENGGATGNKLALIGFSHNDRSGGADDTKAITVSQNLTDNLGTVNGKIDNMTADGGTNYSAALKKAYDILDGRSDKTRPGYVVFISDGAPGYSGQSLNDSSWNGSRQIADLKGAGITVYTIGISLDSAPAEYLKNMASDVKSEHFKNVSGSDYKAQLSSILNTWAGQINTMPAGTDAIMTDVVNEKYFALVTESCAGLAVAEDGKTITWDIGTIPAEMKEITFKIRPKEGVYGESLPTNESCVLRYTKSDKTTDSITAESPKLTINGPMQPDTVDLPVEKVWQNVPDGTELPEKVTVSLYADGSENPVGTMDLDAEGQWRGVFEGVPKYSGSGDEISYTVGETPVENYTSAYSETAVGGWIITNTYNVPTPPPDPSPAVVNIRASKTLDGAAPSGEVFSFILKNGDGNTVQTKNNAGGTVVFSPLTFSAEGIYTYTLEEALGTDGSINYDGTVYTITVNVIKDSAGNRYTAEVSYVKDGAPYDGEPVFENTTKTGTVIVGKTVSGGGSSTSQRFTFKATLNSAAEADSAESVFSGRYGDVEFVGGTAEFSLKHGESVTISGLPAGTVYYIEETDSDGYTVSVNGRSGSAAEGVASAGESETLNFNNYKAGGSTHIPSQAVVKITAEKTLDGTAPSGSGFTFTLKDESGRTVQTKNNDGGNITFDALTFSKTGIYKYTIEETAGDDSAVNYDSTVYTAVINVTRSGDYRAEVSYEKNGEPVSGTPVFENTTKKTPADPDEGTVSVSVSKVWNDGNGKNRPDSVKVQLYKDGNAYGDIVVLSAPGGWTYTWQDLEKDAVWSVDEAEVPDGYKKSVAHRDNIWIITNTARALDDVPQTGDTGSAGIWLVIAAASALGLAGTIVLKKRGFEKRK